MAVLLPLIVFISLPFQETTEWRLDKDKNDIQVYTRKVEGFPIRETKAEAVVASTDFEKIFRLFVNIENYPEWIADIKEAELVEKINDSIYNYRMVIDAPFPVGDRDLVSEMKFVYPTPDVLRIEMKALPDLVEEEKGLIRIPYSTGFWEFRRQGDLISIMNQFQSDPGGSVPSWVVNTFLANNPYQTVKNLKEKID